MAKFLAGVKNRRLIILLSILLVLVVVVAGYFFFNREKFNSFADEIIGTSQSAGGTIWVTMKTADNFPTWSGIPLKAQRLVGTTVKETKYLDTNNDGYAKFTGLTSGTWRIVYTDLPCSAKTLNTTLSYGGTSQLVGKLCTVAPAAGTFTVKGKIVGPAPMNMAMSKASVTLPSDNIITATDFQGQFTLTGITPKGGNSSTYTIQVGGKPGLNNQSVTLSSLGITGTPVAGKTYTATKNIVLTTSTTPPAPPATVSDVYVIVKTDCKSSTCTNRDNIGRVNNIPVSITKGQYNWQAGFPEVRTSNTRFFKNQPYNASFSGVWVGSPTFVINSQSSPNYNSGYKTLTVTRNVMSMYQKVDGKYYYVTEFLLPKK